MVSTSELHGLTTDNSGRPLLLQDSRLATNTFGLDGLYYYNAPKPKYLFFVRFVRVGASNTSFSSLVPTISQDMTSGQDMSQNIGFIVKSVEQPRMNFEVEICNQYNKKRIVQKRVEYQPVIIKFHDTVDNRVYQLFQSYFKHYYGDSQSTTTLDWSHDQISGQFVSNNAGWGYIGSNLAANLADYFSTVEIYQVFAGYYNRYDLINPKITSFSPDEHDFGASGNTHEIVMGLQYEGINYVNTSATLASNASLVSTMGLDRSDYYEPESYQPTASQFGTGDFFDGSGSLANQGLAGRFASNVLTNTLQSFDGGNKLNIGGVFKGSLNQTLNTSLNQNSVVGRIGTNASYNIANAGLINQTPLTSYIPSLRGLGLF